MDSNNTPEERPKKDRIAALLATIKPVLTPEHNHRLQEDLARFPSEGGFYDYVVFLEEPGCCPACNHAPDLSDAIVFRLLEFS